MPYSEALKTPPLLLAQAINLKAKRDTIKDRNAWERLRFLYGLIRNTFFKGPNDITKLVPFPWDNETEDLTDNQENESESETFDISPEMKAYLEKIVNN